jgi:hypothetical protein
MLKVSFKETSWRIVAVKNAGTANNGKRQASQFGVRGRSLPKPEYDVYARLA